MKKYGRTETAVRKTIEVCCDKDILEEYLEEQREEIVSIMMTLFNDEVALENSFASMERKIMEKGMKKGIEKGKKRKERKVRGKHWCHLLKI